MHCLAQPEGLAINSTIAFPEAEIVGEPKEINGASMFFHTFGAMHAVLEYYELTQDERVRDAILRTADFAVESGQRAVGGMFRKVVAFAARYAEDRSKYVKALAEWAGDRGGLTVFQLLPANRAHWTGDTAFLRGSVPGALFYANDAAYTLGGLEAEPEPTEQQLAEMNRREQQVVAARVRLLRESWQSEYDRPEFQEYLREKPRPKKPAQEGQGK